MLELEDKFHLAERSQKYYEIITEVGQLAADIKEECVHWTAPKAITKRAEYLVQLAEENKDLF